MSVLKSGFPKDLENGVSKISPEPFHAGWILGKIALDVSKEKT